nr:patatin-like phospholipase family protein [Acinetobacter sp.]
PNVFVPAVIGKSKYVDGGLVSPIPVQTAKDMGADIVIAVDISARPTGDKPLSMWGLLDQTINIMGQQSINAELKQATVVIQPKVGHLGVLDLKSSNEAILEGEKAAQAQMLQIKNAISAFKKSPAAFKPAPKAKF